MNLVQLNARVSADLKGKVSLEKVKANTTQDIIVEVALAKLFSVFSPEQRARFFMAHSRKPYAGGAK